MAFATLWHRIVQHDAGESMCSWYGTPMLKSMASLADTAEPVDGVRVFLKTKIDQKF